MTGLSLVAHNVHDVPVEGRRLMFHVPTTSLFELDDVSAAVLDLFQARPQVTPEDMQGAFEARFPPEALADTVESFRRLDILRDSRRPDEGPAPVKVENFPLSTIVLNVNTGCNLSCSYCYKEDLVSPGRAPGPA